MHMKSFYFVVLYILWQKQKSVLNKNIITTGNILILPVVNKNIITTGNINILPVLNKNIITTGNILILPVVIYKGV